MSERDYASEIDALAKRIEAIEGEAKRLNAVILDDVLHTLGDMKEVAAIERAATCGTGPNEPGVSSPAQAGMGEASAVSEWPRYFESVCFEGVGRLLMFSHADGYGVDIEPGGESRVTDYDLDEALNYVKHGDWREVPAAEAEARIAAAKGEKPRLDDAFPIPAPVEQGPTPGMKAVVAHACLGQGDVGKNFLLRKMVEHIGPELAAKDAEITRLKADNVRLKDDCTVAGNNIGYRSGELREARLEIERLKHAYKDASFVVRTASDRIEELKQQLSAATAANVERDRAAEAMEWWRKNPCPVVWDRDQRSYGVWGWKCGSRYADNPATALILAARDAAEGNG